MPLVLLLIAILPLKQHPLWTGSGGMLSGIKVVGAMCVVYAVIYRSCRGCWPNYLGTWQARWFLLFALLTYSSYLRTGVVFSAMYILGFTSMLLLYFVLVSVIDSLERLRWVVLTAVASLGWASLYVLREWQKNHGWATGYRGAWVVGDENHFAVSAICAIPLAWGMAQHEGVRWKRWLAKACLLLILVATLLAASRGGFLGLVAALLFVVARSRQGKRNLVVLLVLIAGFNIIYPRSPLQRLLHPNFNDTGSEMAHRASWQAGVSMVREHPLAGIGVGAFKSQMKNYMPDWWTGATTMAHNAYISVAAEMGIPGLLVFLSILIATFLSLERTYRQKSVPPLITRTAVGLQAGLIGSSISISFISAEHHEHLWFIVVMSMCLPPLAKAARAQTLRRRREQRPLPVMGEASASAL
jgi:O-antigen ligase